MTVCATAASLDFVVRVGGRRHQHAHTKKTNDTKRIDADDTMITRVRVSMVSGGDMGGCKGGGGDGVGGGGGPPGGGNDGRGGGFGYGEDGGGGGGD